MLLGDYPLLTFCACEEHSARHPSDLIYSKGFKASRLQIKQSRERVGCSSIYSHFTSGEEGKDRRTDGRTDGQCAPTDLEFVAHADEAELAGLLLGVLGVVGVLKEPPHEAVFGFADQNLQGHVQCIVVLLHKLGLAFQERVGHNNREMHRQG